MHALFAAVSENLRRGGYLPLLLAAVCFALQAVDLEMALRFDRQLIAMGEWWRLLTANFVHLGWNHWFLNMAGLLLIYLLLGTDFSVREWLLLIVLDAMALTLCLYFFAPQLFWYVGFSGTLHGLYAAGLFAEWRHGKSFVCLLGAALLGKLFWEQVFGALPGSVETSGGPVAVDAHLYGALWGLLFGGVRELKRRSAAHAGHTRA